MTQEEGSLILFKASLLASVTLFIGVGINSELGIGITLGIIGFAFGRVWEGGNEY
jgi:hypothetical protein